MLWTKRQAALIRAGQFELVDRENIAEEIESMGSRERRELGNRLEVLIRASSQVAVSACRSVAQLAWLRSATSAVEIRQFSKQSPSLRRHVATEAVAG